MSREITHRGSEQIVSPERLRAILRADGEACYCAPDDAIEWDAGPCPAHGADGGEAVEIAAGRVVAVIVGEVRELVLVLHRDAWGAPVSPKKHRTLCDAAEGWLTEHEGDTLSIYVRPSRDGEVEGLRALRGGIPEGPDLRRLEPDLADLTNRAWEAALKGAR